jgi:hypothetical protein
MSMAFLGTLLPAVIRPHTPTHKRTCTPVCVLYCTQTIDGFLDCLGGRAAGGRRDTVV